jgi:ArsR family transcriptional regulator
MVNEVDIFKALADTTRLKILECIRKKEKCICEIIPYTGKSQPNVSQHLKVMKNAGIIEERKEGTKRIIKVSKNEIFNIIDQVSQLK